MAMTLRLTEEQDRALTLLAQTQGISKQEAAVNAIEDMVRRRSQVRAEILTKIVDEDSKLLDLLSR